MPWNQNLNLNIKVERDAHGYFAECVELEGTQVQGDSLQELLSNLARGIIGSLQRQSEGKTNLALKEASDYQTAAQARTALLDAGFIVLRKDSTSETIVGQKSSIILPLNPDKVLHPKLVSRVRQALQEK